MNEGLISLCCVPVLLACGASPAPVAPSNADIPAVEASRGGERAPAVTTLSAHVETHPSQGPQRTIEGASARLVASELGASFEVRTRELTPGHVYTIWLVAINNPDACAASPCESADVLGNTDAVLADVRWGAGAVADADGEASFVAWAPVGAWESSWFGHGFTNAEHAELHIVVNDHGPLIPERAAEMLTSYREGCTDESLPPPFPRTATSDGRPGPNACALAQDAIFRR